MQKIQVGNTQINIKLIKQYRSSISAQFISPNTIQIKAPKFITETQIQNFLKTHTRWIKKHISLYENEPKLLKLGYKPKYYILFLGSFYKINIIDENKALSQTSKSIKHIVLTRQISQNIASDLIYKIKMKQITNKDQNDQLRKTIIKFLKNQAKNLLITKTHDFYTQLKNLAKLHDFSYKQLKNIRITSAKTRWGSCSTKGTISFSYKLVAAPEPTINYVIAHEIAHLVHMNHSKNFWQLVEQLCPNYKQHQKWLKTTGRVVQMVM